jgi:hypothetical protein
MEKEYKVPEKYVIDSDDWKEKVDKQKQKEKEKKEKEAEKKAKQ